jgi:hypothetical protein
MGFYETESKITYDKAEEIVDEFVTKYSHRRSYVRTRDICSEMEIEPTMLNKIRIHDALDGRCEATSRSNGTKFRIPEAIK